MLRQKLDEYLDGALGDAQRAELEAQIARDLNISNLLAQLKAERALRAAVHNSYTPSPSEAQLLAAQTLAACQSTDDAPLGRVGVWIRRFSAAAAILVIILGSFAMGRLTAHPSTRANAIVVQAPPVEVIRVLDADESGDPQMKEFASLDDANTFLKEMNARHGDSVMVASEDGKGFNPDQDGSF